MKRCISGQKVRVFFPHLVTTLCKRAGVPEEKDKGEEEEGIEEGTGDDGMDFEEDD
ncbi:hypothetical protein Gotri_004311 [Gossypium trilobum]|uniref:Uncharacterized protein n=1 Tax=Gossypium trilobum TaxID=34281 RepID=A0A7J9F4E2_9ROSI|nr:hypothetical protein [Gossypium trilobum]